MKDFTIYSHYKDFTLPKEKTVSEYLLKKAKEHAQNGKTARITDTITGESYDFASFDKQTQNIASALYKRGFRNGDVAVFLTYDISKQLIFMTGVWRANGVPRVCYPEEDEATLLSRVEECRVGWIYSEPESAQMCKNVANQVYWDVEILVNGQFDGCTSIYELMNDDDGAEMPKLNRRAKDIAIIMSTSGTTGVSKGAVLSHEDFMLQVLTFRGRPYDYYAANLLVSKGTHMTGCELPTLGLIEGVHLLVMHKISPENVFEAIKKYQPRHIFAFPSMLLALINHPNASNYDFSCLRYLSCGGSPLTTAMEKIVMQLPNLNSVYNVYGLTEVGPVISSIDYNIDNSMSGENLKLADMPENSSGKLMPGVSAQFRDVETGELVGPNKPGELCIKCIGIFTEYIFSPKATKEAMIDGFFRTGDVGYYDENEFIFLVDRAKEIFKYYGNHISPTEIENIINEHPAVGEVCVIGVEDPQGGGYVPRAFCVILENWDCSPEDIVGFTNSQLPPFKHLRGGAYFLPKLPKGKTGKVTRQLVEQIQVD